MTGGQRWEQNWGYSTPDLLARRRSARELGALAPPSREVEAFLRELGRPVFVTLRRRSEGEEAPWSRELAADHPGYRLVYRNDEIAIFRCEAAP